MKFRCTREKLAKAVSMVGRAVSSRSTLPVLGNILIEAKDGEIRLAATNLQISIDCWIAGTIEQEGAITIPARLFGDVLNRLAAPEVGIETNDKTVSAQIKCSNAVVKMPGIDADQFPQPQPQGEEGAEFDAELLAGMIGQVAFVASKDASRPIIQCVNLTFSARGLTMAATDGYRLGVRCAPLEHTLGENTLLVIGSSMAELGGMLSHADPKQPVIARVDDGHNRLAFAVQGSDWRAEFSAQLTDAKYPDYNMIIPKSCKTTVSAHAATLVRALELARLLSEGAERSHAVCLSIDPNKNVLSISPRKAGKGSSSDAIDVEVKGPAIDLAIDSNFLIEVLSKIKDTQVVLEMSDPKRPVMVRPFSSSPDEFIHVIMPMS